MGYQSFSFMCNTAANGGGAGSFDTSSDPHQPDDDGTNVLNIQEEISEPTTLFGGATADLLDDCGEEDGVILEEGEGGSEVVLRKKKPHLPSSRERNRNSGILSIVQTSSTSTNSSDEEYKNKKKSQEEDEVNIKEYKPLIEFVEED